MADLEKTLCSPDLAEVRDRHLRRLRAVFSGSTSEPFYLEGFSPPVSADPYTAPTDAVEEALALLAAEADRMRDETVFRPLVVEFGLCGVHFVDRIFGANVYQRDGQWWSDPLGRPPGTLSAPDLETSETWRQARAIAEAFLARRVSVPIFGLPTIASALNIAVNLHGPEFLAATATNPELARRDLQTINEVLIRLHTWYRERIPAEQLQPVVATQRCQPPGFGQLCGCSTHLLSAKAYRDLVAAFDDALLRAYPNGGMIHLCGHHVRHIPVWRQTASLRAVQMNDRAAEDLEAYFHGLRGDQVIYLNPTPIITPKRAAGMTGGRRLVIVGSESV